MRDTLDMEDHGAVLFKRQVHPEGFGSDALSSNNHTTGAKGFDWGFGDALTVFFAGSFSTGEVFFGKTLAIVLNGAFTTENLLVERDAFAVFAFCSGATGKSWDALSIVEFGVGTAFATWIDGHTLPILKHGVFAALLFDDGGNAFTVLKDSVFSTNTVIAGCTGYK